MRGKRGYLGFTLVELTMVVVIISLLATIAVPRFADVLRKSSEGGSKGNLGAIRSALKIYYGNLEGQFPNNLLSLTVSSQYLRRIPKAQTPSYHGDSSTVTTQTSSNDAGGWSYNNVVTNINYGIVSVNCTHTDSKGTVWTVY